jgi:hypothetical protein
VVRQEEIIEEIEILMLSAEPDFQIDGSADPPNRQGCAERAPDRTAHSRQENI